MFEYKVQKVSQNNVDRATEVLSERGAEGWRAVYFTPFSQDLIVIFERYAEPLEVKPEPAPKKKTTKKVNST